MSWYRSNRPRAQNVSREKWKRCLDFCKAAKLQGLWAIGGRKVGRDDLSIGARSCGAGDFVRCWPVALESERVSNQALGNDDRSSRLPKKGYARGAVMYRSRSRAFTLQEIFIVLIALGLAALVAVPNFSSGQSQPQSAESRLISDAPPSLRGNLVITGDKVTVTGEVDQNVLNEALTAFLAAQSRLVSAEQERYKFGTYFRALAVLAAASAATMLIVLSRYFKLRAAVKSLGADVQIESLLREGQKRGQKRGMVEKSRSP